MKFEDIKYWSPLKYEEFLKKMKSATSAMLYRQDFFKRKLQYNLGNMNILCEMCSINIIHPYEHNRLAHILKLPKGGEELIDQSMVVCATCRSNYNNKHIKLYDSMFIEHGIHEYMINNLFLEKGIYCHICSGRPVFYKIGPHDLFARPLIKRVDGMISVLTKDHIIPKAKGGEDVAHNIQPACLLCNQTKSDKYSIINWNTYYAEKQD